MDRLKQYCPYCQESIYANALVCRYCSRDLPPNLPPLRHEPGLPWLPLLISAALVIGATALFRSQAMQERLAGPRRHQ
jgi:hypothetical protein